MIKYCDEIDDAGNDYGKSLEVLENKSGYKNSTSMCILQIGELTTHLTEDFKNTYNKVPWQDIKKMRNIAAHNYGEFDTKRLWDSIIYDIPALREYCEKIIEQLSSKGE